MNKPCRLPRLTGWIGRCAAALVALAVCGSALAADPGKNVIAKTKPPATPTRSVVKKQLYVFTSASAIPQPMERVSGPIVTTAIPIQIIANRIGN